MRYITKTSINFINIYQGFWSRFFPAYEFVRQQIQEGAIGEAKFVQASFGLNKEGQPRFTEKQLGGGALLGLGCYTVQFANMIFNGKLEKQIVATGGILSTGKLTSFFCIQMR